MGEQKKEKEGLMVKKHKKFAEGNSVVLFAGFDQSVYIPELKKNGICNMKAGSYYHEDVIGRIHGSRVRYENNNNARLDLFAFFTVSKRDYIYYCCYYYFS